MSRPKTLLSLCLPFAGLLALSACQPDLRRLNVPPQFRGPLSPLSAFNTPERQSMHIFRGSLHSHTSYSDGILIPREAYRMAQGNGLDFMAITEHNHDQAGGTDGIHLTDKLYEDLKKTAAQFTKPGKFVAMYGQEYSTISSGNHMNIFEASEIVRVPNGDYKQLYEKWLPSHPEVPFVQFNHPNVERDLGLTNQAAREAFDLAQEERAAQLAAQATGQVRAQSSRGDMFNDYGYDDYNQDFRALARAANPYVQTIEILNGPGTNPKPLPSVQAQHEKDYFFYLNQGFKLAPTADQDNHYAHWGNLSPARTGVLAAQLDKGALYDALRNRRVFASEDANLGLTLQANNHWMGEVIPAQGEVVVQVQIEDLDEPNAVYQLQLFGDTPGGSIAQPIAQQQLTGNSSFEFRWNPPAGVENYVFAKVVQFNSDGSMNAAWSAPVWILP